MPTVIKCFLWESLFHRSPNYSIPRVFGYICFPWLKPHVSSKLDPKSQSCVFLGYSLQHKGYKCLDFTIRKIYLSRHVIFDEVHFPFHHIQLNSAPSTVSQVQSSMNSISTTLTFNTFSPAPMHPNPALTPVSSPTPTVHTTINPVTHSTTNPNLRPMKTRFKFRIFKPKGFTTTKHYILSHISQDYIPSTYL